MASVLQVISAIERIGNAAVDIARIVTHRLGIPRELVADLSNAEEVSHRVRVREGSHLARRPLAASSCRCRPACGSWPSAASRDWITDVDGDAICLPGDVLFLRGSPAGIARLRELAAAPFWEPPVPPEDGTLSDLDRAVDVLVEMKNISEVAVGLAYSALVLRDQGLAAEVRHLEDRLDEMKDRLELWVLRAARPTSTRRRCAACCTSRRRPRTSATPAQQMVWLIEQKEELHPILSIALGRVRRGRRAGAGRARAPRRRGVARPSCSSTSSPASTCSPSAAAAATSTGPGGHVRLAGRRRAHRLRPRRGPPDARRALRLAPHRGRRHRRAGARAAAPSPA